MTKDEQKEEKRRVLVEYLEQAPRGTKTRLAKYMPVTGRTVSLWLNGERWPQTREDEMKMWEFVGYTLRADGSIIKKSLDSPTNPQLIPAPSTPEETEGAIEFLFHRLSKLRADQWDALRRAARIVDQGGKNELSTNGTNG